MRQHSTIANEEETLFEACRVLFGSDMIPSRDFLMYLQEQGIASAFRKRAMDIHPDKVSLSGLSKAQSQQEFISLQIACKTLRQYIATHQQNPAITTSENIQSNTPPHSIVLPEIPLPFGRFLYHMGLIQWRQIIQALTWQKSGRLKIGELGVRMGYLDRRSIALILRNSVVSKSFGLTAFNMGFLTKEEVRTLLLRQKLQQKKIGQFFLQNGVLTSTELKILLEQCREHNFEIKRISENSSFTRKTTL